MKKTILLVDDELSVRESLSKVLRSEGFQVVLAADGQEAIDQFNRNPIDLVLLDLSMPVKDGWDAFEQFTAKSPLVPIIIITGRSNQHDLASAAGVGALLEKPLDIPALLQTINALLREPPETHLRRLCGREGTYRHRPPSRGRWREKPSPTTQPFTHPYSHAGINE